MLFVTPIATSITSWAHNCWASAPAVTAFQGTISVPTCCRETCSLECVIYHYVRSAQVRRLVTSIATRNNRVAKLVLRQAFTGPTRESICRAFSRLTEVTVLFILAVGTLNFTIAKRGLWDAFSTSMAFERLQRTLRCCVRFFGGCECAFFVGSILVIKVNLWRKML